MEFPISLGVRLPTLEPLRARPRRRLRVVLNPQVRSENQTVSWVCGNFIPRSGKAIFMAKRRGNPNWGKPEPIGPITPTITEFEQVVREYKLTPDQYLRSTRLREWARRNKNSKYIPEPLLEAWGFEIESTL
jgi:hypothetical protein